MMKPITQCKHFLQKIYYLLANHQNHPVMTSPNLSRWVKKMNIPLYFVQSLINFEIWDCINLAGLV